MPHLKIYGIPLKMSPEELENMTELLKKNLADIRSLKITEKSIFIFYPADWLAKRLGEEIICDAVLFESSDRTPKIRKEFAERIVDTIQPFFPEAMIRCMVFPFDHSSGYASGKPQSQKKKRRILGRRRA